MTHNDLVTTLNVLLKLKYTMVGPDGLDNIACLLESIKATKVRGSFVETGVWRGGASIWARAFMDYLEMEEIVYVCDSFKGLPYPESKKDKGDYHFLLSELSISLNTVKENFGHFPITGRVEYIEGLFKDTMPKLKNEIKAISILRVDADMYEGTMQVLDNLYDKISKGGFIIVDDYCIDKAKLAIDEFRDKRGITSKLIKVNNCIHFWQV